MGGREIIFTVEESPEGGYEARAIGHSMDTEAKSLEDLRRMVRDPVNCHFDNESQPAVIRLHYIRSQDIPPHTTVHS